MFTNSSSTNPRENFMNLVDVFTKTKQLKIGDINKPMDKQGREDKKFIQKQESSPEMENNNDMCFKKNLNSYENIDFKKKIELDLSVPIPIRDNLGISTTRGMSFMMKSPDFFKRVNSSDETFRGREYVPEPKVNFPEQKVNFQEQKINYEKNIHDARFNRNRSLHNATIGHGMPQGFFYQNELFNQYSGENDHIDGIYMSQIHENFPVQPDINSQSNNLFGQPFFNKKRSYSEADLNKPNRNNPFSNFRRSSQFNDDFHKKSRPGTDTCIDPRMFYKNICASQISNKENHAKPAFSYAQIITRALNNSSDGKLTLGEIYKWIEDNFEYYKFANPVWKNSIRHNLSLSKCFKKVAREPGTRGKGGKWMIDKEFIAQEENRKKRKSFEEENMMNHSYNVDNAPDPRFYQM